MKSFHAGRSLLLVASTLGIGCNQQQGAVAPGTSVAPAQLAPVAASTAAAPAVDSAKNAANKAQYEQSVAQAALERAYNSAKEKFGQQRIAIVIIDGVPGPEAEADHYLERKLFKAAYAEYEEGAKNAQAQTEANRKAAEEQAIAQNPHGFGVVWYRYKAVRSDVPYPQVSGGPYGAGRHVYYVGPVTDLNAFTSRTKVGNVVSTDPNSRTVTIQSFIPSPIPDIDEEELYIQHGRENVLTVEVTGAAGDPDRVPYYIETQLKEMKDGNTLIVVGPRAKGEGQYRVFVAPVKNVEEFAAGITFGSIADLDVQNRRLTIAAKLPDELPRRPTAAELAEKAREEREGDERPKKGETEVDWAIRVLKKGDASWSVAKVLKALATMDVDAARLEEVGDALTDWANTSKWAWHNSKELFAAIDTWSTDKTSRYLISRLNESGWDKKAVIGVLAKHPSESAARAVAALMTDRQVAIDASAALRDMGPVAEDTVLKLAQDQYASMRIEAYDILRTIGTQKSVSKLKANQSKEKDKAARDALKSAIEDLEARLKSEAAAKTP